MDPLPPASDLPPPILHPSSSSTTTTTTTSTSSSLPPPPPLPTSASSTPLLRKVHKKIIKQYASRVLFCSSEYDNAEYSHKKLLGKPCFYPGYGDSGLTWAPRLPKDRDCVIVKFRRAVNITALRIFETNCPGATVRISAKKASPKANKLLNSKTKTVNNDNNNNNNNNKINNNNNTEHNNDRDEMNVKAKKRKRDGDEDRIEEEGEGEADEEEEEELLEDEEEEEEEDRSEYIDTLMLDAPLSDEWVVLWEMSQPPPHASIARVFSPPLSSRPLTQIIRIDIDSSVTSFRSWYEIDAIQLVGEFLDHLPAPPPNSLAGDFGMMFDMELCCDTEISFRDGKTIRAHAGVLAARCPIFRAMLTSGMKESETKKMTIDDIPYDVMRLLIRYLYTGYVVIPPENFVQLYYAADKYGLTALMAICENDFALCIDEENVISLYIAVMDYPCFRQTCCTYITRHYKKLANSPAFATLPHPLLLEIMRSVANLAPQKH